MKAVIVDDENHAIETLIWEIQQCKTDIDIVATFNNPNEASKFLNNADIDILFLDVEMPFMNGFELLESLDTIEFEVVFTTAYDKFALHAFKVSALDYLLKPVDRSELELTLEKANSVDDSRTTRSQLKLLAQKLKGESDKVALPSFEGLEFVNLKDIIRCKSDSNYTNIYLVNGKKILVSKTLKQVSEILKEGTFFRVHNSHLINISKVSKYIKGDGGYVILEDDSQVDVARSRKKDFLEIFK